MRDLNKDLQWLTNCQKMKDLSDDFIAKRVTTTRKQFQTEAPELSYGITFVESTIAREWLERAIKAETK